MSPVRIALWGGVGLWVTAALVCFALARPNTALHSRSVGVSAAVALVGYVVLLLLDTRPFGSAELVLFVLLLLLTLLRWASWELWLVRADVAAVEAQIATGCEGLFIRWERLPGQGVRLTARGDESRIRLRPLGGRLTWVILPRPPGRGKVTLLVNWLAKQYPGPFPRPRIHLQRGN
jgi:hypothetical protein